MSWFSGARARLHLLFAGRAAESRMDEELAFHVEMETNRLVREGRVPPDEARRRALATFGGVTQHKETLRDGRGLAWLGGFSLDMKLGARMLRKYPGLTLVGGLAMAFAIWVGAVIFQVMGVFVHPSLPLPDGDRIVQVGNWNTEEGEVDSRAVHDFLRWRGALRSITDLGAYRDVARNLITSDGEARAVIGAEVTATAFRVASTAPLLGRVITPVDEQPSAPPVVVIGYDLWRTRFASDPGVIGRRVKFGEADATVVGVMPKGFAFPVAHELWTQLRPDLLDRTPGGGPGITIFGKLAADHSLEDARAEMATIGQRAAAEFAATHKFLQARVGPYAEGLSGTSVNNLAIFGSIYFFALLLLVLVCSNVALLLFARAATREGEIIVRSALGANRSRIVMQLFAEALVLGGMAAVVGLAAADYALRTWAVQFVKANLTELPFWYNLGLSPATVAYALMLTLLSAVIAGVLPGLKITRGLGARLKQGTAGGGGIQFGGIWTVVIVAQVAVTVAFPSIIFIEQRELRRIEAFDVGFAAGQYLGLRIDMDDPVLAPGTDTAAAQAAQRERYRSSILELRRRVAAEPGVEGVTFVDRLPRMFHREGFVEVDGAGVQVRNRLTKTVGDVNLHEVSFARIHPSYFSVLKAPVLSGRAFDDSDVGSDSRVVIVDQAFVDQLLEGRNAVGRRMRFVEVPKRDGAPEEPWLEIVGVVKDLGMTFVAHQHRAAGVYIPAQLAYGPFHMAVHAPRDPLAVGVRVREIAAGVDPMLRLSGLQRVDQVAEGMLWIVRMWLSVSVLLAAIAVLLSLAGIYAVLSFTVARRTREIGVRVALGASRTGLVAAIFRRPLTHVTVGVAAGATLIVFLAFLMSKGDGGMADVLGGFSLSNVLMLLSYVTFMLGVCLLACVVPTYRALRVEPTEALRAE
jgi:putative ABC transport system permease protein